MSRTCAVCRHPKRDEIDARLARGSSYRDVSRFAGTPASSLHRHARHLPVGLVEAEVKRQLREAVEYLSALEELHATTAGALRKAVEIGDLNAIGRLVTAAKGIIETSARLTGELRDQAPPQVAVILNWGDDATLAAPAVAALPAAIEAVIVPREEIEK